MHASVSYSSDALHSSCRHLLHSSSSLSSSPEVQHQEQALSTRVGRAQSSGACVKVISGGFKNSSSEAGQHWVVAVSLPDMTAGKLPLAGLSSGAGGT